ncbi:unnamed protein product [Linum trigynum]|uniref:Retrotransposon gag domain-containing protein n=1 Tax=Linum trigynum TaxID=586398 RepID=A0AAV2EE72_9ROSI
MEVTGLGEKDRGAEPHDQGTEVTKEAEEHDGKGSPRIEESAQAEGAALTKEELLQIIESQDHALEILKKEVEALKRNGGDPHTPGSKRKERDEEGDGASSLMRRTEEMGHLTRHLESDYDDYNGWAQRRAGRGWGVRQPLARSILAESPSSVIPALPSYDGTNDPEDHLNNYFTKMQLYSSSDATMCRAFPSTFTGVVLDWYHQLEEGRIDCFEHFASLFLSKFASRKRRTLTISALFKVRQRENEPLRDFYERWMSVAMAVKDVKPPVLGCCLDECTTSEELCRALSKRDVTSTEDLDRRVQKVIMLEETLAARRFDRRKNKTEEGEGYRPQAPRVPMAAPNVPFPGRRMENQRPVPKSAGNFTELNDTLKNVLQYVKDKGYHLRWPGPMRRRPNEQNLDRYCEFHRERGHHTADCYQLKSEIQGMVDRGMLNDFVKKDDRTQRTFVAREAQVKAPDEKPEAADGHPKEGAVLPPPQFNVEQEANPNRVRLTIEAITGSIDLRQKLEEGRRLKSATASAREAIQIRFNEVPEEACRTPSTEALEIRGVVAGCEVKRMLVDTGSFMDVLFLSTFEKMQLAPSMVTPADTVLIGFSGAPAQVIGRVRLPVTLGDEALCVTHTVDFGIVDCPSPYNAILGRPLLALFNGVASSCHQVLKFVTLEGIGISRGEASAEARLAKRSRMYNIDTRPEDLPRAEAADEEIHVPRRLGH